ncbi:MAG: transposase [Cyanobacteria bacterium J06627_8]
MSAIVQNFKSISTRRINQMRHTSGTPVWQRNFYERIIRNEIAMHAIRRYIQNWKSDSLRS